MGQKQHWKDKKTNVNVKKKKDHLCVKSCLFVWGGKHTWGREHKWSDLKRSLEQHLQIPRGHSLRTSEWDSPSTKRKTQVQNSAPAINNINFHAYLAWADNNAAPRPHRFWSLWKIRIWSWTSSFDVLAGILSGLTCLQPIKSIFSKLGRVLNSLVSSWDAWHRSWLFLDHVCLFSIFSSGHFGRSFPRRGSGCIALTLDDELCIGQMLRAPLCRRCCRGGLSFFEQGLILRLENSSVKIPFGTLMCASQWRL